MLWLQWLSLAMGTHAQNLVKTENFDTPLNNEKTKKIHSFYRRLVCIWQDKRQPIISPATDDEKHGNAVQIETTTDNSWYKAYLGQSFKEQKSCIHILSFEALTDGVIGSFFIRDAKQTIFSLCVKDLTQWRINQNQSAVQLIKPCNQKSRKMVKSISKLWFFKTVNAFASIKGVEIKGWYSYGSSCIWCYF